MPPLTQSEEKRRGQRHHLGRVAAIVFGLGAEQHYCLVTDISEGGVRLHIKELNVPGRAGQRECERSGREGCWR
jgi:hypothetical protein